MKGERLVVLPDVVYYHRLAVNKLTEQDFAWGYFIYFSATNQILVNQASSGN